jgi:hypothetical protein
VLQPVWLQLIILVCSLLLHSCAYQGTQSVKESDWQSQRVSLARSRASTGRNASPDQASSEEVTLQGSPQWGTVLWEGGGVVLFLSGFIQKEMLQKRESRSLKRKQFQRELGEGTTISHLCSWFRARIRKHLRRPVPVFVDLLKSPGIDFRPGRPVGQPCLSYRPARLHRLAEWINRNRFLGPINVYKYGLRNRQATWAGGIDWLHGLVESIPGLLRSLQIRALGFN